MENENRSGGGLGLILAFLGGAVAGGLAALLMAPKSGRETRGQIADTVRRGRDVITKRVPGAFKEAGGAAKEAFSKALEE